jgi:GR25 family glycosyltransferase involved in LPS biosynthesis
MKLYHKRFFILTLILVILFVIYISYSKQGFEIKNYMDGIDVIYWINLDRSPERRNNMQLLLSDKIFKNIPNNRISATDGKNPENIYKKLNKFTRQEGVTDYEYACLISHLDAINTFSKSNHNVALIMEDDATLEFKKYWKKSVREILDSAPSDWDIIYLFYNVNDGIFIKNDFEKMNLYGQHTLSYLINKNAALKLMLSTKDSENGKYNLADDKNHIADYYPYQSLNTYIYKYPYFIYKTENDSDIHSDHLSTHVMKKNNMINAYENLYQ